MIYLASPYSDPDPAVQEERFQTACRHAAKMMRAGIHVFSPIAHSHPIARYGLPGDWSFWKDYNCEFLKMCTALDVLMMPRWNESTGVAAEIALAHGLGKPVRYEVNVG